MKTRTLLTAACLAAAALTAHAADSQRQAEVARRGADVMPFDLSRTTHVFTRTSAGGVQRVIAKDPGNKEQVKLVREHLREIQGQFRKGDYSGPTHIHGEQMPGLKQLKESKPGDITVDYKDVKGGAELVFRSKRPELVTAVHQWFDAQVSDHGADAMAGHTRHGDSK